MASPSIMVATDLSERSDRAMGRAFLLASELDARLTVYSVVDDSLPKELLDDLVERKTEHLQRYVDALGQGVSAEIVVEKGDPYTALTKMVNGSGFDLVIFGRHRHRGFLDSFRRTTVESVAVLSNKPLLLVVNPPFESYQHVLVPTAFSASCSEAVKNAMRIAPSADIKMIHAWQAPFEGLTGGADSEYAQKEAKDAAKLAADWVASLPLEASEVELVHGGVGPTIATYVHEKQPDLLAIGAHTRSASISGLGASTSELLRDPLTDLLISK